MRKLALCVAIVMTTTLSAQQLDLGKLRKGQKLHGFRVEAIYLNDADQPFGGRFVHERSGFTLDALQIETAPQGFIWVNTFPTSDKGEPHTQEHLLLGKGNVGRAVASLESMTLTASSAFTDQWKTCYHFNTSAGPEVYYLLFERQLDALLHPDYTDEEIRREVRNFGVSSDPKSGVLRLEEKGTVYNEMVSSSDRPTRKLYDAALDLAWGEKHPLSFNAGGAPAAIRQMTPQDIRTFHAETHHLDAMGMIGAYPRSMPLGEVLARSAKILDGLRDSKEGPRAKIRNEASLPPPSSAPAGTVKLVKYPLQNESQPSPVALVWPANRKLDPSDALLLELFLENVAGDPTTNLYKLLVDSRTRTVDLGAQGVFAWSFRDQGRPFVIGISDVAAANLTEEKLRYVRSKVVAELERIASWKDGSPELAEFQKRMRSRVVETRRGLAKFVNSPPGFGSRSTGSGWVDQLLELESAGSFERSVTRKPQLAAIEKALAGEKNIWRQKLREWKVTGAEPAIVAAKPDAALLASDAKEREERIAAELATLKTKYAVSDDQEAIRRFDADYDVATAELERIAKQVKPPKFLDAPPLGLDDELVWAQSKTKNGVPLFAASFESMSSATTSLALKVDGIATEDLFLLSILPSLLTDAGVIIDGKPVSFEEMSERQRNEILSLDAAFSSDFRTGRAELMLTGAGNDMAEARKAIDWMRIVLTSPDWRPENLARLRDLVDQRVAALRNRQQGSEESWVNDPADSFRRQDDLALLATSTFLTRAHNAHRLRWLLREAGDEAAASSISAFLKGTGESAKGASRAELAALAKALASGEFGSVPSKFAPIATSFSTLAEPARSNAIEAGRDLDRLLSELPDESMAADWAYLCDQMSRDLAVRPADALARLDAVRRTLLRAGDARLVFVGSSAARKELDASIGQLAGALAEGSAGKAARPKTLLVRERLARRSPEAKDAFFVGLVAPQLKGGVHIHSVSAWNYADRERDELLDFLASRLYAGGGAHGIFMRTWGAGLAYSNGFRGGLAAANFGWYAERTPELPETLKFVIDTVKNAPREPELVEYAIAGAFGGSRAASAYETRAMAMANDIEAGWTPETVAGFRKAILALRGEPGLSDILFDRMSGVYARVLPGLGSSVTKGREPVFFVIGNDKQIDAWQQYLRGVEGEATRVWKLYPRDYWME
ncbi:MAG: hypothetical protein NDJ92_03670 [Thermoanaerobaculia bacterium]|nr:hypothetical protein [Thermoanaerobaculia bacterium]